ncbi:hypothetical protein QQF64_035742 [Cirrhinus molitorella]|uniref:Uncharacterized protein n=1 Tax=Cirrhinus molitorella TaxID=172907 RepID=A0ABR3NGL4_9TELE
MAFIKEENEDVKIEEVFIVKQEDTEEQTDFVMLKKESEEWQFYRLTSSVEFHDLANRFSIGMSTACNIFWEMSEALCCLKKKSLQDLQSIIDGF